MLVYLWTTVAPETPVPHGNLGISDDDGRARGAAEHCLRTGQARLAFVQAAQIVIAAHSLSLCYLPTGPSWWATPGPAGEVQWVESTSPGATAGLRDHSQTLCTESDHLRR